VSYEGYREMSLNFLAHLEVATPKVVLIINFGPPYRLTGPAHPAGEGECFSSFVAGLTDTYTHVASAGPAYTLQVDFTPLGAYRFFGMPMHLLANRVVSPGAIDKALGARFIEQLHEVPSWEIRFALLDQLILKRLTLTQDHCVDVVAWAWRQLYESRGSVAIGVLADEAGCSAKHFIAQFREQLGLPPKALARMLRFGHVISLLERDTAPDWSALARQSGYYDQAHFIKDFRQFAGVTPGDYHRRLLPGDGGVLAD
jgi:AraC-like DNA-binding protein